eukprot:6484909-Amphidinium_carterae.1
MVGGSIAQRECGSAKRLLSLSNIECNTELVVRTEAREFGEGMYTTESMLDAVIDYWLLGDWSWGNMLQDQYDHGQSFNKFCNC